MNEKNKNIKENLPEPCVLNDMGLLRSPLPSLVRGTTYN